MGLEKTVLRQIDPELQARLEVLAARKGCSVQALAEGVLRAHLDIAEQRDAYQQAGESIRAPVNVTTSARLRRHFIGVDVDGFELPERTSGRKPPQIR